MSLTAEELSFGYPGREVGSGVNLQLGLGELLCLLGPNGSGKTTLLKTLLGLLPARAGRVTLEHESLDRMPAVRLAQLMAYAPQAHVPFFPFQVRDIVLMGRTARIGQFATPGPADQAIARNALDTLGIGALTDRIFGELSGGERQLALLARALAQETRVLILDEPTASLDFGNQVLVLDRVRALADGGMAVVLSTHDPDHALMCADRVALLQAGRLLALGPPLATLTPARLHDLYGIEVAVTYVEELGRHVCRPHVPRATPSSVA